MLTMRDYDNLMKLISENRTKNNKFTIVDPRMTVTDMAYMMKAHHNNFLEEVKRKHVQKLYRLRYKNKVLIIAILYSQSNEKRRYLSVVEFIDTAKGHTNIKKCIPKFWSNSPAFNYNCFVSIYNKQRMCDIILMFPKQFNLTEVMANMNQEQDMKNAMKIHVDQIVLINHLLVEKIYTINDIMTSSKIRNIRIEDLITLSKKALI